MNKKTEIEQKKMKGAMILSLLVGIFLLFVKVYAWWITGSTAIMSDAIESIVHIFAVGFAAYSLWLSLKPPDEDHTYGHDKIAFFSAGFEGALIIVAALYIAFHATTKLITGSHIENINEGIGFVWIALFLNGFLGWFLIRQGKKFHSLVLTADGKHIFTDCLTSAGVILALLLTKWTKMSIFDPLIALLIAFNILWTGTKLIGRAVYGLMDRIDPKHDFEIHRILDHESKKLGIKYHHVRHRNAGARYLIEVHLLFPEEITLSKAHEIATALEHRLEKEFSFPAELVTHLEPLENHDEFHVKHLGRPG